MLYAFIDPVKMLRPIYGLDRYVPPGGLWFLRYHFLTFWHCVPTVILR